MKKSIIVPVDFSDVSKYALEHAYLIAKKVNKPITLIHIVSSSSEIEQKEKELKQWTDEFKASHDDIEIDGVVRKGNIFKSIYNIAQELDAYLAVMGTHGQKTIKKAMKVVRKFIKIAFVLVQSPPEGQEIKKILVPLDSNQKTRANFNWVKVLGRYFDLKVYMLYPVYKNDEKNKLIVRNLKFAEKILDKELIAYQVVRANQSHDYPAEIFAQIKELEIDMLSIMSTNYKPIISKLKSQENLETYKHTPVLCVNPRIDLEKFGGLT
jgi:nucleotide-binding universal stress UspA family protein